MLAVSRDDLLRLISERRLPSSTVISSARPLSIESVKRHFEDVWESLPIRGAFPGDDAGLHRLAAQNIEAPT
jgi:hypothetical protein